jgi:hypothetical protein
MRDVISQDRDHLRVEMELKEAGGAPGDTSAAGVGTAITAAAACSRTGERRLTADGAALDDARRWKESVPVRTFAPDDLRLIKGSPRRRREYLDSLAMRSHPEYQERSSGMSRPSRKGTFSCGRRAVASTIPSSSRGRRCSPARGRSSQDGGPRPFPPSSAPSRERTRS